MSFSRKFKRRKKQNFMKDFKKSMDKFKKNVKCAICGVQPEEGQKIDNWFLTKIGEQISLVCTDCKKEEPDEDSPEMPVV